MQANTIDVGAYYIGSVLTCILMSMMINGQRRKKSSVGSPFYGRVPAVTMLHTSCDTIHSTTTDTGMCTDYLCVNSFIIISPYKFKQK